MPIYEYKCDKCGVFEVMQRITESPLRKCPTCKGKVDRQISRGSFILKGSGWYATDYAKKSTGGNGEASTTAPASDGGSTNAASDSSSKSGSESKPASESKSASDKPASSKSSSSEKSSAAKSAD
jgi:putative FmdB family regulatory protein